MTITPVGGWPARRARGPIYGWLRSALIGVGLGILGLLCIHLGLWQRFAMPWLEPLLALTSVLSAAIGPVWIPMALVGLRVGWLAARALRSRFGIGPFGRGVRRELGQLAPLFAALGLAGTVWGLTQAFSALEGGEFLDKLPRLLAGLGAAMTSTLVGLSLQIATLLIAAYNPAWSRVRIERDAEREIIYLDETRLGTGTLGFQALIEALAMRQPEALRLDFDPQIERSRQRELHNEVWRSLEASIPFQSSLGPTGAGRR